MKADDVLKLLEKHEESCDKRYAEIQRQLDKLDMRLWGIAALIVATALANRFI
jgi:chaperonin cofactor prefoldin|tara:strand:+ start:256 stop:414 length:159 start_codon:yes stop_codon:yes gene_type:complete